MNYRPATCKVAREDFRPVMDDATVTRTREGKGCGSVRPRDSINTLLSSHPDQLLDAVIYDGEAICCRRPKDRQGWRSCLRSLTIREILSGWMCRRSSIVML